jgi:hypothetical protein
MMSRKHKKQNTSSTSSKRFVQRTHGITNADLFNIVLFHASYVEEELNHVMVSKNVKSSEQESSEDETKIINIVTPVISCSNCSGLNFQSKFETGKLYKVATETVSFFTISETNHQNPDEWHAVDVFLEPGSIVLFLDIVKYEFCNAFTNRKHDVYVLRFLHKESIVQYPVFQHSYNIADDIQRAFSLKAVKSMLLTALADKLFPF